MTNRFRRLILTALIMTVGIALPNTAAAEVPCTDAYMVCLNDSWDKKGWFEILADIECGARFARCIAEIFTDFS